MLRRVSVDGELRRGFDVGSCEYRATASAVMSAPAKSAASVDG